MTIDRRKTIYAQSKLHAGSRMLGKYKQLFIVLGGLTVLLLLSIISGKISSTPSHDELTMSILSRASADPSVKIILGYTDYYSPWNESMDFSQCKYRNCEVSTDRANSAVADIILFEFAKIKDFPQVSDDVRSQQYWVIVAAESSAYKYNHFHSKWDGVFNHTLSYRRSATLPAALYGPPAGIMPNEKLITNIDYSHNRSKGAYVYVSNCNSIGYERLDLIHKLQEYIDISIFGACGEKPPCAKNDLPCEQAVHSQYRFVITFENSLCQDYITEKFWGHLHTSDPPYVPIVMGGISVDDYIRVAPINSFIHVYNFTTIIQMGAHLQYLMANDDAYNYYHEWRNKYHFTLFTNFQFNSCEICRIANEKPHTPAIQNVSAWWNDENLCRTFKPE